MRRSSWTSGYKHPAYQWCENNPCPNHAEEGCGGKCYGCKWTFTANPKIRWNEIGRRRFTVIEQSPARQRAAIRQHEEQMLAAADIR